MPTLQRSDSSIRRRPLTGISLQSEQSEATWVSDTESIEAFLGNHDNFICDTDGVIWHGAAELPGAFATIQDLRDRGKRLVFVTNQSDKSRAELAAKFTKHGCEVDRNDIVTSASAAADYLVTFHPSVKKVYVIGQSGVVDELEQAGIACCGGPTDAENEVMDEEAFADVQADASVGAVICGWDLTFNFQKLCMASLYLQRGCVLIATNRNETEVVRDGRKIPGNGALLASIEAATGVEAIVTGKPSQLLGEMVIEKYDMNKARTCVLGDRVDTDVALGKAAGVNTMLLMSGMTHEEDLADVCSNSTTCPTYICEGLGKLSCE